MKFYCYAIFAFLIAIQFVDILNAYATGDQITLFVPAFEGSKSLGKNVATVLNLQIWRTLRRAPWPNNPDNLDFGKGLILWDKIPLKEQSHIYVERIAADLSVLAQLVLWGKAFPYGDGVVVQTNLTIPNYQDFRQNRFEIWEISNNEASISVDIPRRRLEMSSIVLRKETIEQYSFPSALKIYRNRVGGEPIGVVGDLFTGIQFENDLAKVQSGNVVGWVRLPPIEQKPNRSS